MSRAALRRQRKTAPFVRNATKHGAPHRGGRWGANFKRAAQFACGLRGAEPRCRRAQNAAGGLWRPHPALAYSAWQAPPYLATDECVYS